MLEVVDRFKIAVLFELLYYFFLLTVQNVIDQLMGKFTSNTHISEITALKSF